MDESFAVAMNAIANKVPINADWMHGINLTDYINLILSCLIVALIGEWLPDPVKFGLDYALVAVLVGLLYLQQLISNKTKNLKKLLIAMLTKNLMCIVVIGMCAMAAIQYFVV